MNSRRLLLLTCSLGAVNYTQPAVEHNVSLDAQRYFLFMSASVHQHQQKSIQAEEDYKELFTLNPPPQAYENYIKFLFGSQQFSKITALPDHILEKFKNNIEIQLNLAQAYLYTKRVKEAEKLFEELTQKHGDHEQVAYYVVQYHMQVGRPEKAIAILEKFLSNVELKTKHALFYFLQSKTYLQMNQPQKALHAIQESLKLHANFDKGWLFKGLLHEQLGHVSDAITGYKKYLDVNGKDENIEKRVINLLFRENRFSEAAEIMKKFDNGTALYFFEMGFVTSKSGNKEKALEYLGLALDRDPNMAQALLLKADILLSSGKQEEALILIADWISKNPTETTGIEALLLIVKAGAEKALVLKSIQKIPTDKRSREIELLEADLQLNVKEYAQARKLYEKVLEKNTTPFLVSFCHYQIGYSYLLENKKKQAIAAFEEATNQTTVYPGALNSLAYELASENKTLDRALLLCSQARKKAPQNPYFLHTEGFIHEKLGSTTQAKNCYQKALEYAPTDATIKKSLETLMQNKKL